MTRQAYSGTRPRIAYLAVLSAAGLLACASPATTGSSGNGGSNGSGNGGSTNHGGSNGTGSSGSARPAPAAAARRHDGRHHRRIEHHRQRRLRAAPARWFEHHGRTAARHTGGTTGSGGSNTGSRRHEHRQRRHRTPPAPAARRAAAPSAAASGCSNTDPSAINEDASGYICGNSLGIKGAWYCYTLRHEQRLQQDGRHSVELVVKGNVLERHDRHRRLLPSSASRSTQDRPAAATRPARGTRARSSASRLRWRPEPAARAAAARWFTSSTRRRRTWTIPPPPDAPGVTVPGVAGSLGNL